MKNRNYLDEMILEEQAVIAGGTKDIVMIILIHDSEEVAVQIEGILIRETGEKIRKEVIIKEDMKNEVVQEIEGKNTKAILEIEDTLDEVILGIVDSKKNEVILEKDDNLEETVIQEKEGKREEVTQGIGDMRRRTAHRKERYPRNSVMMNKKLAIIITQLSLQSIRETHCSQL